MANCVLWQTVFCGKLCSATNCARWQTVLGGKLCSATNCAWPQTVLGDKQNTEILKSIHPIITFTYCKDGKKEIALRIIAFLVILLIGKFLSQQAQEISGSSFSILTLVFSTL